jgi:hypothetical protein
MQLFFSYMWHVYNYITQVTKDSFFISVKYNFVYCDNCCKIMELGFSFERACFAQKHANMQ